MSDIANCAPTLRTDFRRLFARRIADQLIRIDTRDRCAVEELSYELAGYLDKKPEELFGMTLEQLYEAVAFWKLAHPAPVVVPK